VNRRLVGAASSATAGVHGALVLVQVLFASLAIVGRLVLPVVPPGLLVTFRIVGAALALLAFNALRRGPWIRDPGVLGRIALAGLLGVTANQSLFLFGLRHSTAVNATVLVTTVPVFTVLGSLALGLERPSGLKLAGIGLAALGAVVLVGPERLSLASGVAFGNLLILLGMVAYAAYFLLAKPLVGRFDPITVSTYVMAFAGLGALPLGIPAVFGAELGAISGATWKLVGYIVVGPTIAAYFLNLWALQRVSSHAVASFIYLQPLFAALAAPIFLPGEPLTPRTIGAGLAIFAGLGLVIRAEAWERREVRLEPGVGE
jgi:drug/metabolite transporter (DMT)-like permease